MSRVTSRHFLAAIAQAALAPPSTTASKHVRIEPNPFHLEQNQSNSTAFRSVSSETSQ